MITAIRNIWSSDLAGLDAEVNSAIKEGWRPVGATQYQPPVNHDGPGTTLHRDEGWWQTMVMEGEALEREVRGSAFVLRAQPGDTVVVEATSVQSSEQLRQLERHVASCLRPGVHVLVLAEGERVRREPEATLNHAGLDLLLLASELRGRYLGASALAALNSAEELVRTGNLLLAVVEAAMDWGSSGAEETKTNDRLYGAIRAFETRPKAGPEPVELPPAELLRCRQCGESIPDHKLDKMPRGGPWHWVPDGESWRTCGPVDTLTPLGELAARGAKASIFLKREAGATDVSADAHGRDSKGGQR